MAKKKKSVTQSSDKSTPRSKSAALGPDLQAKIGDQLRAMHDDVVKEGVPPRFAELLAQLDAATKKG